MTTRRGILPIAALSALLATIGGGCATQTITASLPKAVAIEGEPSVVAGSTASVYGLIAAGAMSCWFAVNGQLKKSHIFHADADSPAKGGAVEIAVLERDVGGPKPWGAKAFKIMLSGSGEQTAIEIQNLKMPENLAGDMRADAFAWAQGRKECKLKPVEVAPPEPQAVAKKAVRSKTKAVANQR